MADGDLIDQGAAPSVSDYYTSFKLIDAAVATDSGAWVDVRGFANLSLDVTLGGGTATVQLMGSNAPTRPANNVDGRQIGANITADGIVSVTTPVRWLKVKVSAYTSGTINANLQAVN